MTAKSLGYRLIVVDLECEMEATCRKTGLGFWPNVISGDYFWLAFRGASWDRGIADDIHHWVKGIVAVGKDLPRKRTGVC